MRKLRKMEKTFVETFRKHATWTKAGTNTRRYQDNIHNFIRQTRMENTHKMCTQHGTWQTFFRSPLNMNYRLSHDSGCLEQFRDPPPRPSEKKKNWFKSQITKWVGYLRKQTLKILIFYLSWKYLKEVRDYLELKLQNCTIAQRTLGRWHSS